MQPGSTCWWHQTLSVLCFFPTAGMLSCHKPFPRLSLWFPSSLPAPDVHRMLYCGLCPTLLLLGFKMCYPSNYHSLENHRRKLFSFLCVITIKEVFTFLPERQTENAHVRGVLIHPWRNGNRKTPRGISTMCFAEPLLSSLSIIRSPCPITVLH